MDKIRLKKIPKKIVVVKPSSLGDIVHSFPFLAAMKETFPSAEIHWVVAKGLEGLLENHPMVKKLWVIDKDKWKDLKKLDRTVAEISSLSSALRAEGYDIAVDLQGLLRSGLLTRASRAPVRVGFREAREGSTLFYTHRISGGRETHAVERYLKIAAALGCETGEILFPLPLIKESGQVRTVKAEMGNYAVIAAGARWTTKKWPAIKFGHVASRLQERSIVVGSTADAEDAEEIAALSGGKAISMAGKTGLGELISLVRDARYVITNDSGPMHIAAAAGVPVVALFGPTNPVRTGPYGDNHVVLAAEVSCAPCYKKACRSMRCMEAISVESVLQAVRSGLTRKKK
jgi:lipopolysaccharide heptosyltransferase I